MGSFEVGLWLWSEVLTWDDLLILSAKLDVDKEVKAIKDGNIETLFDAQDSILDKTEQKAVLFSMNSRKFLISRDSWR